MKAHKSKGSMSGNNFRLIRGIIRCWYTGFRIPPYTISYVLCAWGKRKPLLIIGSVILHDLMHKTSIWSEMLFTTLYECALSLPKIASLAWNVSVGLPKQKCYHTAQRQNMNTRREKSTQCFTILSFRIAINHCRHSHTHAHNALLLARLAYYPKSERISCCCYCCWCVVCAKRPWLIIVDESNVHKSRIDRLLGHYFSLNRSISILWHKSTDFRRSIICHRLESKRLKWIDAPRRFSAADRVFSCIHLLKALVLLSLIICHYFDHMLDVWAWASAMQMAI